MSYLCYLCWYAYSGIQQILCCSVFCFFFFCVIVFILCALIKQFRWTVHFSLLLRYSLTFISSEKNDQRRYKFLTKKISKFLFLAVEDIIVFSPHTPPPPPYKTRTQSGTFFYSNLFITVQTLFSSLKPRFYYISIFKLIYEYYSAS